MKRFIVALILATVAMSSTTVLAAEQTIKLSVPGMTCASCPFIVKSAISAVIGVKSVEATLEELSATVTFDDTVASIDAITQATRDVGYESSVMSSTHKS